MSCFQNYYCSTEISFIASAIPSHPITGLDLIVLLFETTAILRDLSEMSIFREASQPLIDIAEAMSNEFSVFDIIVCSLVYVMLAHDNVKILWVIYKSCY
jgi:hypothetical protein